MDLKVPASAPEPAGPFPSSLTLPLLPGLLITHVGSRSIQGNASVALLEAQKESTGILNFYVCLSMIILKKPNISKTWIVVQNLDNHVVTQQEAGLPALPSVYPGWSPPLLCSWLAPKWRPLSPMCPSPRQACGTVLTQAPMAETAQTSRPP